MPRGHPAFLVSAYGVAKAATDRRERMLALLSRAVDAGQMVLMDSGNYESFWKGDRDWITRDERTFAE